MARPTTVDSYRVVLTRAKVLGQGFAIGELVRPNDRRKVLPPPPLVDRMIPTLRLAIELRKRMIERHGIRGLRVNAAYRRDGGSKRSQHKRNAALDLDLMQGDYDKLGAYYEEAVRLWCEVGAELDVGLGLYCGGGKRAGIRVHLDTGMLCRTWQRSGGAYIHPAAALKIAARLKLTPPTERDRIEGEGAPAQPSTPKPAPACDDDDDDAPT